MARNQLNMLDTLPSSSCSLSSWDYDEGFISTYTDLHTNIYTGREGDTDKLNEIYLKGLKSKII